ncbi:hypothetical protein [Marinobacter daepoensis]|uniref:hypothetical protein n=1 Tax=Marinobacter daepoensis TaxID=262077 RepID=UPI0004A48CF1|nr:hypothetical protein [Marinobacter daepoensis]MBY6034365.1 hypothetical protein [Marinobacter daepoensis]
MSDSSNGQSRESLIVFVNFTKGLFFLALTVTLSSAAYLLLTNPELNRPLYQDNAELEKQEAEKQDAEPKKWSYTSLSDVAVASEKYPIVVLRTGFKVIRVGPQKSLVGWKYEIVNTSPSTKYVPEVEFELQDEDGFYIASGRSDSIAQPESYGVITGTIEIDNIDLGRLSQSSWVIQLSSNWEVNEAGTAGKRYDRLKALAQSQLPAWAREEAEDEFLGVFSDKWKAIQVGLGLEFPKDDENAETNSN